MKAIVQNDYGSPDVLELKEVAKPTAKDNEVLIRVHAASLNAGDVFSLRGSPWLIRLMLGFPGQRTTFSAGTWPGASKPVGNQVTRFKPGDEVFAACHGRLPNMCT